MNAARVIYHLARADFYERVRRYSFLIMLGLSVFLSYQVANGNLTLNLGRYRGEFNSAWVGAMISIVATFFIGWFGFYLVKGTVARDRETGVGQIIATTPLNRPLYLVGKWLSNFAVLMTMVVVLALAGIVIQLWQGENTRIDWLAYFAPFLFIVLPLMALIAAIAVLFETIPFLQGSLGNVIYFILFIIAMNVIMQELDTSQAIFDPLGIKLMEHDMGNAVRAVYPNYVAGLSFSPSEFIVDTFKWNGIDWTFSLILSRWMWVGIAFGLVLLGAVCFDRFDPARAKPRRVKINPSEPPSDLTLTAKVLPNVHLTPLQPGSMRFSFLTVLLAELKILLKGQRWWWYAIAGALILAGLLNSAASTRELALPLAWVWPVLIWSGLGNRETHHNVQRMSFSSAFPVWRQLPAQWLAGFIVALLMASGAIVCLLGAGDRAGLLALFSGALLIPSLALACGVWSGGSKLFEIVYLVMVYLGSFNRAPELDFSGASSSGRPEFFIPFSIVLIVLAIVGRVRQVRS
jgi:hypothetical protein